MLRSAAVRSVILLGSGLGTALHGQTAPPHDGASIAITHVTVIDVASGERLPDRTVLIRDNHIASVARAATAHVAARVRRVDGRGKYVIPGLWDMHEHVLDDDVEPQAAFPELLANGVTGFRDMWGNLKVAARVRGNIAAGRIAAPRFILAGGILDGPPGTWPGQVIVRTPAEGRRAVDSLASAGANFIKVYSLLTPDVYAAIADEAKRRHLPFAGHVPEMVGTVAASDAGQRSLEHGDELMRECWATAEQERFRSVWSEIRAARARRDSTAARLAGRESYSVGLAPLDTAQCDAMLTHVARNGTAWTPTLVVDVRMLTPADSALAADPLLRYATEPNRAAYVPWLRHQLSLVPMTDAAVRAAASARWSMMRTVVARAARAGVMLLAGSDAPNPYIYHGFGLQDELVQLVDAGLSPLAALQAATLNPARFLHATDSLGSVTPGKLADLVLLDADPLVDIHNTQRIRAVVANGRLFDRAALDTLLVVAERAARLPAPRQ